MYEVSEDFMTAMRGEPYQRIRGIIECTNGDDILLDDTNLLDDIQTESQCVENLDTFNFGELYTGSTEFTVCIDGIVASELRYGLVILEFGAVLENGETEWIPLGQWDIMTADRTSENQVKIKGYDMTNRLKVPLTDHTIGRLTIESAMKQIEKDCGVEFEQTPQELQELFFNPETPWVNISAVFGNQFHNTGWDEVRAISQVLGGFAFANRHGRIEFKRFDQRYRSDGGSFVIPAKRRFSVKLAEDYCISPSVAYTYSNGKVSEFGSGKWVLNFANNRYLDTLNKGVRSIFYNIAYMVRHWKAGEIEFYGNPAIDLGDMVHLSGGVVKNQFIEGAEIATAFLVCGIRWKFRGGQTLISSGVSESSTSSSSGSSGGSGVSGSVTYQTTINQTEKVKKVDLNAVSGFLFEEFTAVRGAYSCRSDTTVFTACTFVFLGTETSTVTASLTVDGVQHSLQPRVTLHENEYTTLNFQVSETMSGGTHSVEIVLTGNGEIESADAYVWGQNVTDESPEHTEDEDYTYTVTDGLTTVTGYRGQSKYPNIPTILGGGRTTIIGNTAFSDSLITAVYIPDGVTEIQ